MEFECAATDEELEKIKESLEKEVYKSSFFFLKETRGLRPGFLTGLLGTTGCGKSTLVKSIIAEVTAQEKTLVILSEEDPAFYSQVLVKCNGFTKENIFFLAEKSFDKSAIRQCKNNAQLAFEKYKRLIIQSSCKVIFFDNLSTSQVYVNLNEQEQGFFAGFLSDFAEENGLVIFFVAHTGKQISDYINRLITGDDIRGSNQLFMKSSYFYIMQRFCINQNYFSFIRIRKHRGEVKSMHKDYALVYREGMYVRDSRIDHDDIAEMFTQRNRLLERKKKKQED